MILSRKVKAIEGRVVLPTFWRCWQSWHKKGSWHKLPREIIDAPFLELFMDWTESSVLGLVEGSPAQPKKFGNR